MNLAANARDAMPQGGRLTIEISREEIGSDYTREHLNVRPGTYVRMAVTDTGKGMSKAAMDHLFEPFFTTKEPGKGTGLGLSTIYGIVRNFGGHIWVHSEGGQGTSFKIYLPEADAGRTIEHKNPAVESVGGTETILLVEDEASVRQLVKLVLEGAGYRVIPAQDALEALEICRQRTERFHLLLTDMVMPKMGGRELAEQVCSMIPDIKVIVMSGYTDDTALGGTRFSTPVRFIQKPALPNVLREQVRQALDG